MYGGELTRALDPSLDLTSFRADGRTTWPGDLAAMSGRPWADEFSAVWVSRPGVRSVGRDDVDRPEMSVTGPVTATDETSSARLFEPATLLLEDPFRKSARPLLGSLFREVTVLHNEYADIDPQATAEAMVAADVIAPGDRRADDRVGGEAMSDATLEAVERMLTSNPR